MKRSWVDWVWRPAPRARRENSAETLIRVGVNAFQVWFLLMLTFWGGFGLLVLLAYLFGGHPAR